MSIEPVLGHYLYVTFYLFQQETEIHPTPSQPMISKPLGHPLVPFSSLSKHMLMRTVFTAQLLGNLQHLLMASMCFTQLCFKITLKSTSGLISVQGERLSASSWWVTIIMMQVHPGLPLHSFRKKMKFF